MSAPPQQPAHARRRSLRRVFTALAAVSTVATGVRTAHAQRTGPRALGSVVRAFRPAHAHTEAPRTTHGPRSSLDQPMAVAWPAEHQWSDEMEARYSAFVAAIGRAVAAGHCRTLSGCLDSPNHNPLHPREAHLRPLRLHADCADVPYTLRAYFAWRNHLPFAFTRTLRGGGRDPRYMAHTRPVGLRLWTEYRTPRQLFRDIASAVHSGYFRMGPAEQSSDYYQAPVDRRAIRPGTAFYDPDGHVLVVYEVRPDGDVLLFDGHPDNSVSHPHLTDRIDVGSPRQGGGFRNHRPLVRDGATYRLARNDELSRVASVSDLSADRFVVDGQRTDYHRWVRHRLAQSHATR